MEYKKMESRDFIFMKNESPYNHYTMSAPIRIFGRLLTVDDIKEMEKDNLFNISVDEEFDFEYVLPYINEYIKWLGECGEEIAAYFKQKIGEDLPADWLETIEIYELHLWFDLNYDYSAEIHFAEGVTDYVISLYFDGKQIEDIYMY